jgi:hypothetical protein
MEKYKFQTKYNWIILLIWFIISFIYIEYKKNDRKSTHQTTMEAHRGK